MTLEINIIMPDKEYAGEVFVMTSGKDANHFADAASTVRSLEEVYAPAAAARRQERRKPPQATVGLLYDAFTGFQAAEGCIRRRKVLEENHIVTFQG